MIRELNARRGFAVGLTALLAFATMLLAGCGSSGDDGTAQVRVLNVATDVASVDVSYDGTKRFSAITAGALSANATIDATSFTVAVTNAGSPTSLASGTFSYSDDKHYTGVVWGSSGGVRFTNLPEDEDLSLATGNSAVRVFNATANAGAFDVYLTPATQVVNDLSQATPTRAAVATAGLSGYAVLSAGAYRLRITGAGNPTDVRLDVPSVTLTDKLYLTVIITAGPGNSLVNATLLTQQGAALTSISNGQARVRVVASVQLNADNTRSSVSVTFDGVALANGTQVSPNVGAYTTVPGGAKVVQVSLNGTPVSTTTQTLTNGGDYTLMAYGPRTAPRVVLLADDNSLPAAGRAAIRLVNGDDTAGPVTLQVDNGNVVISSVAPGTASAYADTVTSATTSNNVTSTLQIDSDSATIFGPVFQSASQRLLSQGVYSVFLLRGGISATTQQPAPNGFVRKDR